MKEGYIYKITNTITNKVYIGQTQSIKRRFKCYKRLDCKRQFKIYNSLVKYGWENHSFDILEIADINLLDEREEYWINFYDSFISGLNLTKGGRNRKELSDETRRKLSECTKGERSPWYGKDGIWKGVEKSKEHLENISKAKTGKTIEKLRGSNASNYKGLVYCYLDEELIGSYEGSGDAARKLDIPPNKITKALLTKSGRYKQYIFTRELR